MELDHESRKNDNFQKALKEKCVLPFKEIRKIDTHLQEVNIGHLLANVEMTPQFLKTIKRCRNIFNLIRIRQAMRKSI